MLRAALYCIAGILGWVQFLWLPVFIGFSETNVYAWAVCSNCRAFLWIFATVDLGIGLVSLIIHLLGKAETMDIDSVSGLNFVLIVSFIVLAASVF